MKELVLFRKLMEKDAFFTITSWIKEGKKEPFPAEGVYSLLKFASGLSLDGNLWQEYLTWSLCMEENPYTLAVERKPVKDGTIRDLAARDMELLWEYFFAGGLDPAIVSFRSEGEKSHFAKTIEKLSEELAKTKNAAEFARVMEEFYATKGCGELALHRAFRVKENKKGEVVFVPVRGMERIVLGDLVGYENAKQKLVENTECFLNGLPANNCMLYGDAGTGKSSSIKALANQYFDRGLRLIELYKHQIMLLPRVMELIKKRNYRFIIYMDDLSFEDFETEYKYLKAVIEGGLEGKSDNLLIYATSNRRHLIRESFSDRDGDDIHHMDTVQEKQSLSARFGLAIYYGAPEPSEYREIVLTLAKRAGINMPEKEILLAANQWEIRHGGRSGRVAQQVINHLSGKGEKTVG